MNTNEQIFISYKREDIEIANLVRIALQAQGITVWWDEKLQIGQRWEEAIDQALTNAHVVVVLWSNLSVNSDWVKQEASFAKLRKNLVQARIDDCSIPEPFSAILAADLRNWNKREDDPNFREIITEIERITDLPDKQVESTAPLRSQPKLWMGQIKKPRLKFWLLGLLSCLVAVIALLLPLRGSIKCNLWSIACPYKISHNTIADFKASEGTGALTAFGLPFSMISDSSQNMGSTIWYQRIHGDPVLGGFLRIHYQMMPHSNREGYVGIYADFTLPPASPVSLSEYDGMSFKMRINQEIGEHPEIRVLLYSDNIKNMQYAYPIARVVPTEQWNEYNIPFSQFESPPFAFTEVKLDIERVFRFAFVLVSGDKIYGQVDIDDIELF